VRLLVNGLLVALSVLVATLLAEGAARLVDGLPLFTDWLPNTVDKNVTQSVANSIRLAPGVSGDWFLRDPPRLPNRAKPPADWVRVMEEMKSIPPWIPNAFRATEYFHVWNSSYVGDPCAHPLLRQAPGQLYVYKPSDQSPYPKFRFFPNATTPLGLVTNEVGWRGPPVKLEKPANLIRIAFVGASTTVNSHYYPYSYPELIGEWLNLWAQSRQLNVRFETLNAGREGLISTDIEAVIRKEVLPFQPELVVYYEGANQFVPRNMLAEPPPPPPSQPGANVAETGFRQFLREASNRFALARRIQAAMGLVDYPGQLEEWPKPSYRIVWPKGLDTLNPDLSRGDLPLSLSTIITDLDRTREDLASIDSELILSSFKWFVHEGLVLDPVRNRDLHAHLNISLFPFHYRDLAALAAFQNRVYAKYAVSRNIAFLDIAGQMPEAPDLYTDGVHFSYGGVRLHAWIAFQGLIPLIEKRLAEGAWPKPIRAPQPPPSGLFFEPTLISVVCPSTSTDVNTSPTATHSRPN
jgi:hypothetical protein